MTAIQEFIFLALKFELYLAMGSDKFLLPYIIPAHLAAQKKVSHTNAVKLKLHWEDSDECQFKSIELVLGGQRIKAKCMKQQEL